MKSEQNNIPHSPNQTHPVKTVVTMVYALQALNLLLGFTALIGLIIDYVKRGDAKGTWLASHFSWQIKTFWVMVVMGLIVGLTHKFLVSWFLLFPAMVWYVYRIVKGWLCLNEGRAIVEKNYLF